MRTHVTPILILLLTWQWLTLTAQPQPNSLSPFSIIAVNPGWGFYVINAGTNHGISTQGHFESVDGLVKVNIKRVDRNVAVCELSPKSRRLLPGTAMVWIEYASSPTKSELPIKAKKVELPSNFEAKISKAHSNLGFCLINAGIDKGLKKGLRVKILRGHHELGTGVISMVEPTQSIVDIKHIGHTNSNVATGDRVIIWK